MGGLEILRKHKVYYAIPDYHFPGKGPPDISLENAAVCDSKWDPEQYPGYAAEEAAHHHDWSTVEYTIITNQEGVVWVWHDEAWIRFEIEAYPEPHYDAVRVDLKKSELV